MSELKITGLAVEYGGISAVNDVTVTIPPGSVVTLLGANGAGKTSTVRAIMGLTRSSGSVALDNRSLVGTEPFRRVRAGLGYVPEGRLVFAPLTVADNLAMEATGSPGAARQRLLMRSTTCSRSCARARARRLAASAAASSRCWRLAGP